MNDLLSKKNREALSSSNDIVISCKQLTKTFTDAGDKITVFDSLNFDVKRGEKCAIIGASGSGKSTLLHLLGGLDKPTKGDVFIENKQLTTLSESEKGVLRNRHLGFIYQFHHLLPEFNALENVCLPLLIRGEKIKTVKKKARDYIARVGLTQRENHRIGELSGGERQRIAIARALITEPSCVLADEPTGNLDEETANHIAELINQLNAELKTSFVIVTHNKLLAMKMDRTLVLARGELS